ncbi:MAG TPA: alpha/beta hydrolase-fold protein [Gemmatimonadales bacterium]
MDPFRSLQLLSRRSFVGMGLTGLAASLSGACLTDPEDDQVNDGRLSARPRAPTGTATSGIVGLNLGGFRDGVLLVPEGYAAPQPVPLMVLFHGAGGAGSQVLQRFSEAAQEFKVAIVAPDSRGSTWDRIFTGQFRTDVTFIDQVLNLVFDRVAVDPTRVVAAGFSDGASYALSLGLTNGDLFTRIAAFSPGFSNPGDRVGNPPIFISHGTADPVLPIDVTSRRLVPELHALGYGVRYREFEGGHAVPAAIAREGVEWLTGAAAVP